MSNKSDSTAVCMTIIIVAFILGSILLVELGNHHKISSSAQFVLGAVLIGIVYLVIKGMDK
jgi:uncharacterized membrane protein